jgi:hypothetical protein
MIEDYLEPRNSRGMQSRWPGLALKKVPTLGTRRRHAVEIAGDSVNLVAPRATGSSSTAHP